VDVVAVCIVLGVVAAMLMAAAVQNWRQPDLDPLDVPFARMLPFGPAGRSAVGRAMLPWALTLLSTVVLVVLIELKLYGPAALVVVGIVGCGLSVLTIAWFNWPKFLVPPHRRGEPGLMGGRSRGGTGSGPDDVGE